MDNPTVWRPVRGQVRARRAQLRFCLRMTVAGLLALAVVEVFAFPLHGLWTVLTAIVVTQVSIGGSLRATIEYMIGTLGGAIYAAALGVLVPHTTAAAQALVLALAIAPLALAAAINPSFRVAPFSAVLVLLIGGEIGESPISRRSRACRRSPSAASSRSPSPCWCSLNERTDWDWRRRLEFSDRWRTSCRNSCRGSRKISTRPKSRRLQDDLGGSVTALQGITAEARRERMVPFAREPDPAPLSRTLLRLRHDLVILGRAAAAPLPGAIAQRLDPPLTRVGEDASAFLFGNATALAEGRASAAARARGSGAADAFDSEVASLRSEGLTRALSTGEVERLFAARLRARAAAPEFFRSRAVRAGTRRRPGGGGRS